MAGRVSNTIEKNGKQVRGYVLAGGASSRFARDKALVELDGAPMLSRMMHLLSGFTTMIKIVGEPEKYGAFGAEIVADRWPGEGPLGGIITALEDAGASPARSEWNLILSCDMPFLTREWLACLAEKAVASNAEAIAPKSAHGMEPLCACWRTSAADKLARAFDEGVRKVTEAMKHLETEVLDESHWRRFDGAGRLFWNMNTPADYDEAKRVLETERA